MDGSWKQVLNQEVIEAKDAKEWTTFTTEFVVPANAVNTKLGFAVSGKGKAWLDDIVIEKSEAPKSSPARPSAVGTLPSTAP